MSEHLNDRTSHQEFWTEIVEAGGPRKYVETQLRERGVWVKRQDVLSMGTKAK